jgi:hypothetical protein
VAQLTEVVTVSQPAGQPQLGYLIPRVGQRADDLDGFPDAIGILPHEPWA